MQTFTPPTALELISVHIPKTAGSTFGHIFLPQIYGERIFYDYASQPLEELLLTMSPQTQVTHGHFPVSKYQSLFAQAKLVTWVRHPLSMLISWYFFWLSSPDIFDEEHRQFLEQRLSFVEFIQMPYTKNGMSEYYLKGTQPEDFFFIGVQEFFDEDLKRLQNQLGLPDFQLPIQNANVNQHAEYQTLKREILADQQIVKTVHRLNAADVELYETIVQLRYVNQLQVKFAFTN
jgi:hypothetical protein